MPQDREEQKADTEEKRRWMRGTCTSEVPTGEGSLTLGTAAQQHPCPSRGHGAALQICN